MSCVADVEFPHGPCYAYVKKPPFFLQTGSLINRLFVWKDIVFYSNNKYHGELQSLCRVKGNERNAVSVALLLVLKEVCECQCFEECLECWGIICFSEMCKGPDEIFNILKAL